MKKPTPRQALALRFIRDHIRLLGYAPSESEIARHMKITPPAAHDLIVRMERAGHITKLAGVPRSIVPCADVSELERDAKAIVLFAFRNGSIEDIHAGSTCPLCAREPGYSRITDEEMKKIMKAAVNRVFTLLALKDAWPEKYEHVVRRADLHVARWDEPELVSDF